MVSLVVPPAVAEQLQVRWVCMLRHTHIAFEPRQLLNPTEYVVWELWELVWQQGDNCS